MIITFHPLQEAHFPLLLKWLTSPHVKAWWDQDVSWTITLIQEKYGPYVQGYKLEQGSKKPLHAYIICANTHPLGYIQFYNAYDFPREDKIPLEGLPKSLAALDIFIGEEEYIGKGFGSESLKQFLKEHIDPAFEACFVDPDTANGRAIRTYEKAGFKKINTVNEGRITWMVRTKPPSHSQH